MQRNLTQEMDEAVGVEAAAMDTEADLVTDGEYRHAGGHGGVAGLVAGKAGGQGAGEAWPPTLPARTWTGSMSSAAAPSLTGEDVWAQMDALMDRKTQTITTTVETLGGPTRSTRSSNRRSPRKRLNAETSGQASGSSWKS